jgi:hypothetical protein
MHRIQIQNKPNQLLVIQINQGINHLVSHLCLIILQAFVFTYNIISINTYTTILICGFLLLSFDVECVSIYGISLICHNSEYRVMNQLFYLFTCRSIR